MDILRLLDQLQDLATEQPRTIVGKLTYGLDREEITMQIAKIRACLPQELKTAASTVRESERIIETARSDAGMTLEAAKKEADRIIQEAKLEADRMLEATKLQQERMVAESEILKLSKSQSEEIRNAAERDALQTRRGADKYAFDLLSQLESVVGKAMTTLERGKAELQRNEAPANLPTRERANVR